MSYAELDTRGGGFLAEVRVMSGDNTTIRVFGDGGLCAAIADACGGPGSIAMKWEMTGGGCGTLYVGGPRSVRVDYPDGSRGWHPVYDIVIGPGSYHDYSLTTWDLSWGPDDDPNADTDPECVGCEPGAPADQVIRDIVAAVVAATGRQS